jgi:hypothetical protein
MALNFPNTPTNAQSYVDPNGHIWVYETATNSWTAQGAPVAGMVYKGPIDVTTAPPTGATTGSLFTVSTGGTPNAGFVGLPTNVPVGSQIIFDGAKWQLMSTTQPDATETVKGIVELATAAETTTGTDATRAVHPAGLKVELDKKAQKTTTSDTAPTNPKDGDLWYDSVGGELYVWYDSDDAGAAVGTWVQANPQVTPKQATASVAGVDVKLWKKTGTTLETETAGDKVAKAALPSGSVLQVVNATYSTVTTNSTTTYTDTGLTATITPTSSSSKILVLVNQAGCHKSSANVGNGVHLKLFRGSTELSLFSYATGYSNSALELFAGEVSINYLDSPATTSLLAYKTQFANNIPSASVSVQYYNATSTITLIEVAA